MAERRGKKVKAKRRAEKSREKVISSFVVISIVLSVLAASVAMVSALNGGIPSPPPISNVTEIVVTANPESIPADGSSTSTITATVTDWEDKTNTTDPSGFSICFTIISQPDGARLDPICDSTDEEGNASTTLTAGTIPGEVIVKAYARFNESAFDYVTITLTSLPREGSITGKITYSCNETGIAGVNVALWIPDGGEEPFVNTTTDENGNYTLEDIPEGSYWMKASKPRFWDNSTEVEVIAGETTEVNMMLWMKGDLNNNGEPADAVDLLMMVDASVGKIFLEGIDGNREVMRK